MSSVLNIGVSALLAYQRSLATTGHNIANADTEGYSRQRVDMVTRVPQERGDGWVGSGVQVSQITRQYDSFLATSMRASISTTSELETYYDHASVLDSLFGNSDTGLDSAIQKFFGAINTIADDPTSIAARQAFLAEAESLANRFHNLNSQINSARNQMNNELVADVAEINSLASNIAAMNSQIVTAGGQPNDLLDRRDQLINELSELVSVSTVMQSDGAVNVFIGNGQSLVTGVTTSTLSAGVVDDAANYDIVYSGSSGASQIITSLMTGGEVGGLISYRSEILNEAQNTLGLIALGITDELNTQHQRGMDMDGNLGNPLFTAPVTSQGVVLQDSSATGTVAFAYDDITDLTSSDYSLIYNGGTSYTLTRLSDGTAFALDTATPATLTNDGFTLTLGGAPAVGETTYIRPTRAAAGNISVAITSAREVAAASPVLAEAVSGNTGTATITEGEVTDITNAAFTTTAGALTPPILIRFTSATTFDVINASTLATITAGVAYTAGNDPLVDAGLNYGYTLQITGTPAAGDEFTIGYNTNGVGDNRNALALAQIQSTDVLLGDSASALGATASFEDVYGLMVSDVGTSVSLAESNYASQSALLMYNKSALSSVSGVNLDEEAANLVRYQQAYAASAQVIAVANEVFDTLIGAFR